MAQHTTTLPNLAKVEASNRRRRARLDNQISSLVWRMANDEMVDLAHLQQKVDEKTIAVAKLDAAIQVHVDAAERRMLRRELLTTS